MILTVFVADGTHNLSEATAVMLKASAYKCQWETRGNISLTFLVSNGTHTLSEATVAPLKDSAN